MICHHILFLVVFEMKSTLSNKVQTVLFVEIKLWFQFWIWIIISTLHMSLLMKFFKNKLTSQRFIGFFRSFFINLFSDFLVSQSRIMFQLTNEPSDSHCMSSGYTYQDSSNLKWNIFLIYICSLLYGFYHLVITSKKW